MFSTWGYSTKNDNKVETKEWKKTCSSSWNYQWFDFILVYCSLQTVNYTVISNTAMPKIIVKAKRYRYGTTF